MYKFKAIIFFKLLSNKNPSSFIIRIFHPELRPNCSYIKSIWAVFLQRLVNKLLVQRRSFLVKQRLIISNFICETKGPYPLNHLVKDQSSAPKIQMLARVTFVGKIFGRVVQFCSAKLIKIWTLKWN